MNAPATQPTPADVTRKVREEAYARGKVRGEAAGKARRKAYDTERAPMALALARTVPTARALDAIVAVERYIRVLRGAFELDDMTLEEHPNEVEVAERAYGDFVYYAGGFIDSHPEALLAHALIATLLLVSTGDLTGLEIFDNQGAQAECRGALKILAGVRRELRGSK